MAIEREQFIQKMQDDFVPPGRLSSPGVRAVKTFTGLALLIGCGIALTQPFRSGFLGDLQRTWLGLELFSLLLLSSFLLYLILVDSVPGRRIRRVHWWILGSAFLALAGTWFAGFWGAPSLPSSHGARPLCEFEVLGYSALTLGALWWILTRGLVTHPPRSLAVGAAVGGLIAGGLMQLACMHGPWHGALFHYGPVLLMVGLGWGVGWFIQSRR